jgi:nucleotide-binding universal stress UspA family protein
MTQTVLVPIDGSPLSMKALRQAFELFPDASVVVLHVVDLFEPGHGAPGDYQTTYEPLTGSEEWYQRAEEISSRLFEDAEAVAEEVGREITTTSEIGDPQRIILEFTEQENVDHIVLGAHGRDDESRPLYGSNTEIVARRASVPVTIIR